MILYGLENARANSKFKGVEKAGKSTISLLFQRPTVDDSRGFQPQPKGTELDGRVFKQDQKEVEDYGKYDGRS